MVVDLARGIPAIEDVVPESVVVDLLGIHAAAAVDPLVEDVASSGAAAVASSGAAAVAAVAAVG